MTQSIRHWWETLSTRERWLVGVAGTLAAAVIGWFLIYAPLRTALADAREAHGIATDRQAAIASRVAEIRRREADGQNASSATNSAAVTLILTQSAAEQGFTLSRNDAAGDSGASIAMANVRAPALATWLSQLEGSGLTVTDLTLRPNADGTVAMTASIRRAS